jgi:hypothetical protein
MLLSACRLAQLRQQAAGGSAGGAAVAAASRAGACVRAFSSSHAGALRLQCNLCPSRVSMHCPARPRPPRFPGSAGSLAGTADATAPQPPIQPPAHSQRDLAYRSDTTLTMDAPPVVYHPLYSAPQMPPGHRFPMVSGANAASCLRPGGRAISMPAIHCQPASQPCQPALLCRLCLPTSMACCWQMASSIHVRCVPGGLPGC